MSAPVEEVEWPPWIRPVIAATALVLAAAVGLQRDVLAHPGLSLVLVLVALVPWVPQLFGASLPDWLCVAPVLGAVAGLLSHPHYNDFAPFFLVLLAGSMATVRQPKFSVPIAVACAAVPLGYELAGRFTGSVIWAFGIAFAWFFGSGFQWQLQLLADLKTAQAGLAQRAATEERRRVAREVHDVIAHSLSVTMLHLTGARLALKEGETGEAIEALADAEHAGRQAMADIRRTVGLLGDGRTDPTADPLPTADDIPALVEAYRAAGLGVDLTLRGDLGAVAPSEGLALYRIAQEALSNVVKHASGARAGITVDVGHAVASVVVRNRLSSEPEVDDGRGVGLRGMRERAELLDGVVRAGVADDEWVVEATIPVGAGPA